MFFILITFEIVIECSQNEYGKQIKGFIIIFLVLKKNIQQKEKHFFFYCCCAKYFNTVILKDLFLALSNLIKYVKDINVFLISLKLFRQKLRYCVLYIYHKNIE